MNSTGVDPAEVHFSKAHGVFPFSTIPPRLRNIHDGVQRKDHKALPDTLIHCRSICNKYCIGMATIRRLEDKDVRSIFECLHEGRPPPPRLSFQIVPVGPNGLKLSPPSYEFPDGLYVLLRPRSKSKSSDQPQAPPHLQHLIWREPQIPPETCPWSLSGPQFPQPTAIQQRYCYPKGRPEYSSRQGGALWTIYTRDGKEDTEYRLLHVYYSAKRAVNKGAKPPSSEPVAIPSPPKRTKRQIYPPMLASTSSILSSSSSRQMRSPASVARQSIRSSLSQRSSLSSEDSGCRSPPLCLEAFFPPSPGALHHMPSLESSNFISPVDDKFFCRSRFFPSAPSGNDEFRNPMAPRPYRNHSIIDESTGLYEQSPYTDASPSNRNKIGHGEAICDNGTVGLDPFPCDMSASLQDIDSVTWKQDPTQDCLVGLVLKPPSVGTQSSDSSEEAARSLCMKLDTFHEHARDSILAAPETEQASLTNAYANWALHVAWDPLGGNDMHPTDLFDASATV